MYKLEAKQFTSLLINSPKGSHRRYMRVLSAWWATKAQSEIWNVWLLTATSLTHSSLWGLIMDPDEPVFCWSFMYRWGIKATEWDPICVYFYIFKYQCIASTFWVYSFNIFT